MRVAVIVASILVVASSSYASDSCMTKDEARSHFATSYLYWHGLGHCWDANSGRRQLIRNQQESNEVVRNEDREPKWLGQAAYSIEVIRSGDDIETTPAKKRPPIRRP
jgi:hypothetical protein